MVFSFTDYLTGNCLSLAHVADGKLKSPEADDHFFRLLLPPSASVVEVFGRLPLGFFPADSVVRPCSPPVVRRLSRVACVARPRDYCTGNGLTPCKIALEKSNRLISHPQSPQRPFLYHSPITLLVNACHLPSSPTASCSRPRSFARKSSGHSSSCRRWRSSSSGNRQV